MTDMNLNEQIRAVQTIQSALDDDIRDFESRMLPSKYDRNDAFKRLMFAVSVLAQVVEDNLVVKQYQSEHPRVD